MTEDRFDELVRDMARDYHAPPTTPRDEMWAEIRAARDARRPALGAGRWAGRRVWVGWVSGIAAALLVGIGLGRLSLGARPGAPVATAPAPAAPATTPAQAGTPAPTAYRVAAERHLGQASVLLTSFSAEARSGQVDGEVGDWAQQLLSTTRLMLDSPAAADPELRLLLEDLELVLAQIAQLPASTTTAAGRQEVRLVTAAIEDAGVLPKLQSAIREGAPATDTEE